MDIYVYLIVCLNFNCGKSKNYYAKLLHRLLRSDGEGVGNYISYMLQPMFSVKRECLTYGLIGEYQVGKSTLINCLLGRFVASVGKGDPTTHTIVIYKYAEREYKQIFYSDGSVQDVLLDSAIEADQNRDVDKIVCGVSNPLLEEMSIVDLPGVRNDNSDNEKTLSMLEDIDCGILIQSHKTISALSSIINVVRMLKKREIPYFAIFNCADVNVWRPWDERHERITSDMVSILGFYPPLNRIFCDNSIPIINFMWYWYAIAGENDEVVRRYSKSFRKEEGTKDEFKENSQFSLMLQILRNESIKLYLIIKKRVRESLNVVRRDLFPIGCIQLFAFNEVPDGWLPCDGSELEISVYKELYDKIGNRYGEVENGGFRIPDLRNQFVRGWNPEGNRSLGDIQESALQSHGHKTKFGNAGMAGNHSHSSRYGLTSAVSSACMNLKRERKVVGSINTNSLCVTPTVISHRHIISETTAIEIVGKKRNTPRTDVEIRPKNISMLYCIRVI